MSADAREKPSARPARGAAVVLWLIVLVATAIRFNGLTADCMWFDEIWHLMLSSGNDSAAFNIPVDTYIASLPNYARDKAPLSAVWRGMDQVLHPPLYHYVLRAWRCFFGDSAFALRALSACCSAAAVLVMFDCARQIAGRTAGLIAAAALAVAPSQLDQAQEARNYALSILLATIGLALALRAPRSSRPIRFIAAAAVVALALIFTHYFAAGVCAAIGIYLIAMTRARARIAAIGLFAAAALIFLFTWGSTLRAQLAAVEETADIFLRDTAGPAGTITRAAALPLTLLIGAPMTILGAAVGLALLALIALSTRWERRIFLPLLAVALTVLALASLDFARGTQHLAIVRYSVVASPAMILALLCAIEQLRNIPMRRTLQFVLPATLAALLPLFGYTRSNPEFRPLVEYLASRANQAEPVVFLSPNPRGRDGQAVYLYFAFYTNLFPRPAAVVTRPIDGALGAELSTAQSIWVVSSGTWIDPQRVWPGARSLDSSSFGAVGSCVRLAPPVKEPQQ